MVRDASRPERITVRRSVRERLFDAAHNEGNFLVVRHSEPFVEGNHDRAHCFGPEDGRVEDAFRLETGKNVHGVVNSPHPHQQGTILDTHRHHADEEEVLRFAVVQLDRDDLRVRWQVLKRRERLMSPDLRAERAFPLGDGRYAYVRGRIGRNSPSADRCGRPVSSTATWDTRRTSSQLRGGQKCPTD